jgi:hypothetical protein
MRTATEPLQSPFRAWIMRRFMAEACGNRTQSSLVHRDTASNNSVPPRRIISDKTTFASGCTANRYRTATVRPP